jgi:hypothetical protein
MKALGLEHGRKGLNNFTDDVRSTCSKNEPPINLEAYAAGFNMGWSTYCTPFNGFDMGRKGDVYRSFCPPEKEDLFHEKFLIGKKVYEKKDQVLDTEEKIKDLSAGGDKDAATKDELKKNQDDLLVLKREIQALEQKGMSLIHTN